MLKALATPWTFEGPVSSLAYSLLSCYQTVNLGLCGRRRPQRGLAKGRDACVTVYRKGARDAKSECDMSLRYYSFANLGVLCVFAVSSLSVW
jgi:hypothetical protein